MDVESPETSDVDEIAELWVDLADDQRAHGSHVRGRESIQTIRRSIGERVVSDRAFVVREDETIVGFVTISLEDDSYVRDVRRGFIENLFVAPDVRNRGIGSALLERAERALADQGVDAIALEAMAANDAARRFYERAGYEAHRVEFEKRLGSDTH